MIKESHVQSGLRRFVLMQHGLWAAAWDFNTIVAELFRQTGACVDTSRAKGAGVLSGLPADVVCTKSVCGGSLFARGSLTCFTPGANAFIGSLSSTSVCARRLLHEFLPVFVEWLSATEGGAVEKPVFSCVGHSFGGIILREALYLLLVSEDASDYEEDLFDTVKHVRNRIAALGVVLQHFVSIATPHCGAAECLPLPMYHAAWGIAKLFAPSIREILLDDDEALLSDRLLDSWHMEALRVFNKRILFANTQKDMLVGFGTSSLMFDGEERDKVRIMGSSLSGLPCAFAFENDNVAYSNVISLGKLNACHDCLGPNSDRDRASDGNKRISEQPRQQTTQNKGRGCAKLHRTPREIATVLRSELDWELVALRYHHPLPVAHVACIGWCQQLDPTPEFVRRIASEILT